MRELRKQDKTRSNDRLGSGTSRQQANMPTMHVPRYFRGVSSMEEVIWVQRQKQSNKEKFMEQVREIAEGEEA